MQRFNAVAPTGASARKLDHWPQQVVPRQQQHGGWNAAAAAAAAGPTLRAPFAPPPGLPEPRQFLPAGDLFDDEPLPYYDDDSCSSDAGTSWAASISAAASTASGPESLPWQMHHKACLTAAAAAADPRTTVMLQRIGYEQTEATVAAALARAGLGGTFDMIYVPRKRVSGENLGYGFVNFVRPEFVQVCFRAFHGKTMGGDGTSDRVCSVDYSRKQRAELLQERSMLPSAPRSGKKP